MEHHELRYQQEADLLVHAYVNGSKVRACPPFANGWVLPSSIGEHVSELVTAGGVGAVFGTGADDQTYITSSAGQFEAAVTNYFAAPVKL